MDEEWQSTGSLADTDRMDEEWQSTGSLADTSVRMLEEELFCDVTFLAGDSRQEVRALRSMLASRSTVFQRMFLQRTVQEDGRDCSPRY